MVVIVSSVISTKKVLDTIGCIFLFEASESHMSTPLQVDVSLNLQLQHQISNITMRCPYLLLTKGVCRGDIAHFTAGCTVDISTRSKPSAISSWRRGAILGLTRIA